MVSEEKRVHGSLEVFRGGSGCPLQSKPQVTVVYITQVTMHIYTHTDWILYVKTQDM